MATLSWEGYFVRDPSRELYNKRDLRLQKEDLASKLFLEIERYKGPMVVEIIEDTNSKEGLITHFPVDIVRIKVILTAVKNHDVVISRTVPVDVPENPTMKQRVKFLFTGKV